MCLIKNRYSFLHPYFFFFSFITDLVWSLGALQEGKEGLIMQIVMWTRDPSKPFDLI